MTTFEKIHQAQIVGKLTAADRTIFHGHLTQLFHPSGFETFLWRDGVPLKDFAPYVQRATETIKAHAEKTAADAGRPFMYLQEAMTAARGRSKEDLARQIAERDGVREGLICIFSTLEPCLSFDVRPNRARQKLEVVRRRRKCLHLYFYLLDREFGFMHIRLQTWFPFQIQVYINGREWLARQLEQRGVRYQRYENALTSIDDLALAQQLSSRFFRRKWPRVLDAFARRVNPWLPRLRKAGFDGYYWVVDQCEIATDVMFHSRAELAALIPDLLEHTIVALSARDALRFLGKKPARSADVTADLKQRPEGCRVKHRVRHNSVKVYDKWNVLRVETTINNPREFNVLVRDGRSWRWKPMKKCVANFWRMADIGRSANARYLEALGAARPRRQVLDELDELCHPRIVGGRRFSRFQPVRAEDCALFAAVLAGEHAINGFTNRDLARRLYATPAPSAADAQQRRERISRAIAKLRGHGLVAKVPKRRLYRVTPRGQRVLGAALHYRNRSFPDALLAAA